MLYAAFRGRILYGAPLKICYVVSDKDVPDFNVVIGVSFLEYLKCPYAILPSGAHGAFFLALELIEETAV
jgi:hypothetical protein